jgi:hypothetical protein
LFRRYACRQSNRYEGQCTTAEGEPEPDAMARRVWWIDDYIPGDAWD